MSGGRTSPKQGRNERCACGSGKKFKHCHGAWPVADTPPDVARAADEAFRLHEADRIVREAQQGFGKGIITAQSNGYRIVVVAKRVYWSRRWRFFTDFLLDFLKEELGREWGKVKSAEGLAHPIFRWLKRMAEETSRQNPDQGGVAEIGYLTSIFRLAYALYLLKHNDQIPTSLLARLRRPSEFRFAAYETVVAAAFAVSGAKIEAAEVARTSNTTPEFWATGRSGKRYSVEAKCKQEWRSVCDPIDEAFQQELRQWLRDKIYRASKKGLSNPVYWFELSIPAQLAPEQWVAVRTFVLATLKEAENIQIDGEPAQSAYVFVTNHAHLVDDDAPSTGPVAILDGYRIADFGTVGFVDLEGAMESHDQHRDISWVFECLSEVERVPMTFDGTPPELLPHNLPQRLRIGQPLALDFPGGMKLAGVLREICSTDDTAFVVIENESGQQMATMPLTPEEASAAKRYGDAVFGKPERKSKDFAGDPMGFYERMKSNVSSYPRQGLLNQIRGHPQYEAIAALPTSELRQRVARELTKSMFNLSQQHDAARAGGAQTRVRQ